jgi:hypothetical protein
VHGTAKTAPGHPSYTGLDERSGIAGQRHRCLSLIVDFRKSSWKGWLTWGSHESRNLRFPGMWWLCTAKLASLRLHLDSIPAPSPHWSVPSQHL